MAWIHNVLSRGHDLVLIAWIHSVSIRGHDLAFYYMDPQCILLAAMLCTPFLRAWVCLPRG